eukprot:6210026-Pleurochrysis_carterae.AAC.3
MSEAAYHVEKRCRIGNVRSPGRWDRFLPTYSNERTGYAPRAVATAYSEVGKYSFDSGSGVVVRFALNCFAVGTKREKRLLANRYSISSSLRWMIESKIP